MIIGHQKQWQFLRKSFEAGRISHAYLFCGKSELGKKIIAKEFIKLINCGCKDVNLRPCQKCFTCLQIEKTFLPESRGAYPDLNMVEAGGKEIQIAQIRELCWNLSLKPYSSVFKTAIIDDAERMNQEAANALLKTLEEPSGQAVLILISSHPELLPRTIVSRAQIIKFFPLSDGELEIYAKNKNVPKEKIPEYLEFAEGRPGRLIKFILNSASLAQEKQRAEELGRISRSDLASRFQYAKKIADNEENIGEVLESWLRYFRNSLSAAINNTTQPPAMHSLAKIKKIIKTIENVNFSLSSTNVNPRLALEIIMLEM